AAVDCVGGGAIDEGPYSDARINVRTRGFGWGCFGRRARRQPSRHQTALAEHIAPAHTEHLAPPSLALCRAGPAHDWPHVDDLLASRDVVAIIYVGTHVEVRRIQLNALA